LGSGFWSAGGRAEVGGRLGEARVRLVWEEDELVDDVVEVAVCWVKATYARG
jgi:hypothetical protein